MHAALAAVLGALTLASCNFDIQNPNGPEPIGSNPSRARVAAAAIGLLNGSRSYYTGWILNTSILGRDGYRFDGSEPRYTSEALTGALDGGGFIGGSQWLGPFNNIRSANELLAVVGSAPTLSAAEISAVRGYAHTLQALDLLNVVVAHTQDSIPVAVGTDPTAAPAPFVSNVAAYTFIENLLDSAQVELQNGGTSFPFSLSGGFAGFDDPGTFIQFNRALRARVDVYTLNWATALVDLAGSFVDTLQPLNTGVFHFYSTGSGELNNTLNQNTQENFAHPQLRDSAQARPVAGLDLRFTSKTFSRTTQTTDGLTSDLGWSRYPSPSSPIPIIRNEELILIRAEANIQLNNLAAAKQDIDFIRVNSGGLDTLATAAFSTQAAAINALLYERRYSLLFEWGHRWIDMRRYNRLNQLPLDRAGDVVYSTFPIPTDEILARQ
jgi:starch-binding outer membrane protein, SusD/RagB family